MNRTLEITEHQRVPIRHVADSEEVAITPAQAKALRKLENNLPAKAFTWGHDCVVWGSYCGLLPLPGVTLEIIPKLHSNKTDVSHGREVLLKLLSETGAFKLHRSSDTSIHQNRNSLLDIFIIEFCDELTTQLRQGAARSYQENQSNLPVIRGKLLIDLHLKHNSFLQNRLYCQYDELTHDIPLNRIIRATLTALLSVAKSVVAKQNITELLHQLDGVTAIPPQLAVSMDIHYDRNNKRFEPIIRKCRLFLSGLYPDIVSGKTPGLGLLFNMNTLFESWLGVVFRRLAIQTEHHCKTGGPVRYLAREHHPTASKDRFLMKPDFSLSTQERPSQITLIADAKWKLLDNRESGGNITTADLYQIQSYASRYQCTTVGLIYPSHDNFSEVRLLQLKDLQQTTLLLVPVRLDSRVDQAARELNDTIGLSRAGTGVLS